MAFEAKTIADNLRTNWNLTGERLGIEGTKDLERPVVIYSHFQLPSQQYSNGVEVIKRTPKVTEFKTEYFTREEDTFDIEVKHNLEGVEKDMWEQGEADVEDIEEEIVRLIKLIFDPQAGLGVFFTSDLNWQNRDKFDIDKPYLYRIFSLRLTRIVPRKTTSFITYKRGVLLDVSESEGSGLPGSDPQYTEVFNISAKQGYRDFELPVTDQAKGPGAPWHYSGRFEGDITLESYLKSTDLGSGGDKVNQIWRRLSNGEQPEIVLLRTYTNNNLQTLTRTDTIIFLTYQDVSPPHDQLQFILFGKIIKPGTWVVV